MIYKNSNPAFSRGVLKRINGEFEEAMSFKGALDKSLILVLITLISGGLSGFLLFNNVVSGITNHLLPIIIVLGISTLVVALVTTFKPNLAYVTAPVYAILEGGLLSVVSVLMEIQFPGIVMDAIFGTMMIVLVMLIAFKNEWIKVTDKFRAIVVFATMGIFLVYLISFIANLFGAGMPYIHSGGIIGIIFSIGVIIVASMNLLLDFDMMKQLEVKRAGKHMEWYCGFALLVTILWIYVEVLRLLSKIRSND